MQRFLPKSLLGQMLLAVGMVLLVAQTTSAVLQIRAYEQRQEMNVVNDLAFQLVADPRFDYRDSDSRLPGENRYLRWMRLRVQRTPDFEPLPGEERQPDQEALLRSVLVERGIVPAELFVLRRRIIDDEYLVDRFQRDERWEEVPHWAYNQATLAALRREGEQQFTVARLPNLDSDRDKMGSLIAQTLLLYVLLVGGLAILLRRITRPLAALTRRLETFTPGIGPEGQLEPSGPEDTRRLISAHNAMEGRIAALLHEKDVMLGAIGHDLKTPLTALRVRIESVEDATERERMAATIEDITATLDDILSLARVGRPSDPMERTELSALVAGVVEEFEDMNEPVELGHTDRIAMPLRATWLRRALRNLVSNAMRYGLRARVTLHREGSEAVVRIEDDGPGIPDGNIEAMLEPFARGEASRNRETGGAGLGLTLARAIAGQHGGRLKLSNRRGPDGEVLGLTAELYLPAG